MKREREEENGERKERERKWRDRDREKGGEIEGGRERERESLRIRERMRGEDAKKQKGREGTRDPNKRSSSMQMSARGLGCGVCNSVRRWEHEVVRVSLTKCSTSSRSQIHKHLYSDT
jgi:hypothetical protein